jgi:hypothetical protein
LSVLASQSAKVYSYYYSQDSDWAWPLFGRGTLMEGRSALHALDMPLFWNYYPRIPSSMRGISNLFVDYFTSFAYGNIQDARHPRSLYQQEGLAHLPNWPVFNDTERMYLDLGSPSNQATVRSHLRQQYCNILNHFY